MLFCALAMGAPSVRAIKSKTLAPNELKEISEVLQIREGSPLNLGSVDQGIKKLYGSGRYGDLQIWSETSKKGVLTVYLEGTRLKKLGQIDLSQVAPEIREMLSIDKQLISGERLDMIKLKSLSEKIQQAMSDNGFGDSTVEPEVVADPDGQTSNLTFKVSPGNRAKIDQILIKGTDPETAKSIENGLKIHAGDFLDRKLIEESTQATTDFLKSNQYPFARVKVKTEEREGSKQNLGLVFEVSLGQQYRFQISGNTVFDRAEIRSSVSFDLLSQSDAGIRIKKLLEDKYRYIGYHFVNVEAVLVAPNKEGVVVVKVNIQEGHKVLIDKVVFDGLWDPEAGDPAGLFFENATGVIRRRVFWEGGLEDSTQRFISALRERGYLSATITGPRIIFSEDQKGVQLFYDLKVGNLFLVKEITFVGNENVPFDELIKILPFKKGESVNREMLNNGGFVVKSRYQNFGFLDAKVSVEEIAGEVNPGQRTEGIEVKIKVEEGKKYLVGKITVEGFVRTQEKVIRRELMVKTGDPYDPDKIRQSEDNLALLGLFSRVELIPSSSPDQPLEKNLLVLVSEIKPGFGEVGLGGLYEDPLFRARSFLGLGYRNLFGLNQTASLRSEVSLPISRTYSLIPFVEYAAIVGYRAPYLADLPLVFNVQGGFDSFQVASSSDGKQSDLQTKALVEERIEKRLARNIFLQYRLHRLERTRTESIERQESGQTVTKSDVLDRIGSTGPTFLVDFRNDLFNPTSGSLHSLDCEFAHPSILSNEGLSYVMALQRNTFYLPISKSVNFAFYIGSGWARALLERPLPEARLAKELALGGQGTIRGYAPRLFRAPAGVREMAFYNVRTELTIPIVGDLGGAIFFDTGQLFPNLRPEKRNDGVGIGVRYKTPVGPVVLDLAHGLSPEAESIVRFTFTVGSI